MGSQISSGSSGWVAALVPSSTSCCYQWEPVAFWRANDPALHVWPDVGARLPHTVDVVRLLWHLSDCIPGGPLTATVCESRKHFSQEGGTILSVPSGVLGGRLVVLLLDNSMKEDVYDHTPAAWPLDVRLPDPPSSHPAGLYESFWAALWEVLRVVGTGQPDSFTLRFEYQPPGGGGAAEIGDRRDVHGRDHALVVRHTIPVGDGHGAEWARILRVLQRETACDHPNIVTIVDIDPTVRHVYTRWYPGGTLAGQPERRFTARELQNILAGAWDGLKQLNTCLRLRHGGVCREAILVDLPTAGLPTGVLTDLGSLVRNNPPPRGPAAKVVAQCEDDHRKLFAITVRVLESAGVDTAWLRDSMKWEQMYVERHDAVVRLLRRVGPFPSPDAVV